MKKKTYILAALTLAALVLFSGCGGNKNGGEITFNGGKMEACEETPDYMSLITVSAKTLESYDIAFKETNLAVNSPGKYFITYTKTDKKTSASVDVTYDIIVEDTTAPVLHFTDKDIYVVLGDSKYYTSIMFYDVVDGESVCAEDMISGSVDINTEGNYPVKINVSDRAGNKAEFDANIIVVAVNGSENSFFPGIQGFYLPVEFSGQQSEQGEELIYQIIWFEQRNGGSYCGGYEWTGKITFTSVDKNNSYAKMEIDIVSAESSWTDYMIVDATQRASSQLTVGYTDANGVPYDSFKVMKIGNSWQEVCEYLDISYSTYF